MSSTAALRNLDASDEPLAPRVDKPNFDRLARVYRWMEWLSFGPYLWKCRSTFLPDVRTARRALVLGDGDGRFTAALLRENRHVVVDAVDLSAAMLRSLSHRCSSDSARLQTQNADVREWTPRPTARYDLVATHFFLDCLTTEEIVDLARRLRPSLAPGARWILSEFAVPNGPFGHWVAQPIIAFLYRAFGLLTGLRVRRLPDYGSALPNAGFRVENERRILNGLLLAQVLRNNIRPDSHAPSNGEQALSPPPAAT